MSCHIVMTLFVANLCTDLYGGLRLWVSGHFMSCHVLYVPVVLPSVFVQILG